MGLHIIILAAMMVSIVIEAIKPNNLTVFIDFLTSFVINLFMGYIMYRENKVT